MTNYLANLTDAELADRLAKIEALGKETAARIASGEQGRTEGSVIRKGRWVSSCSLQSSLNVQRAAWKDTKGEISRRKAA